MTKWLMSVIPLQTTRAWKPVLRSVAEVAPPRVIDHALKAVDLTRALLDGPTIFVPCTLQAAFAECVARQIGERHLGPLVVRRYGYEDLDLYAKYVLGAPRLDMAFARGIRALPFLQSGAQVSLRDDGDRVVLQFGSGIHGVVGARHLDEGIPLLLIDLVRHFAGPDWHPVRVELPHPPPAGDTTLDEIYDAPIRYGLPFPGIAIPKDTLSAPNRTIGNRGTALFSDLKAMIRARPSSLTREVVWDMLALQTVSGDLTEDAIVARMGLGKRTLQRRLSVEGSSFAEVLAAFRIDRARQLLIETEQSQKQIAAWLGYREVNSFRRAFRNATGMTPTKFVANHSSAPSGAKCNDPK